MDRLSLLDAQFVEAEDADPRISMAIASIAGSKARLLHTRSWWPRSSGTCRWCPATARSCGPSRCALDHRYGWTTRSSMSAVTSAESRSKAGGDAELGELMAWVMAERRTVTTRRGSTGSCTGRRAVTGP